MPSSVTITDVALRDGLQNHPRIVPTDRKLSLLQRLLDAGVVSLEVGSFVHPKLVPAMADTEEVHRRLPPAGDARLIVLVPNLKGARRALAAGAREVGVVPLEHVRSVVASLVGMGFGEVCLSDTLGRADPAQVERTVAAVRDDHPG